MNRQAVDVDAAANAAMSRLLLKSLTGLALSVLFVASALMEAQNTAGNFNDVSAAATSAREQGDIPQAVKLYRQAVQLNPAWPDGWWYLGTLEYGASNYVPAADALSRYIELTPAAGPALALRGLCEFELGQYAQALQDLEHGIALGAANQPRNGGIIFYHEAILLTRLGRFEEALEKFTVIVKHGNTGDDVTDGVGLAALRMPILPSQIDPSGLHLASLVGSASTSVMNGDLNAASQAFSDIFQRFPATPNLHYSYGYLLSTVDPQQAIFEFRKELDISPSSAIAHSMLAWTLGLEGDFAGALPYATKAVEEDPSLAIGQLALGRDLIEDGDIQAGLPHLEAVLQGDPNNLEAHLALVKAYSRLGRKDDARKERLLCLTLTSQHRTADANP
jgi:tetratricopeptide (TPR) repeat protein